MIDLYWDYTGTGWITYLKHAKPIPDPAKQYKAVARADLAKNKIVWLPPAPLNNTYAFAIRAGQGPAARRQDHVRRGEPAQDQAGGGDVLHRERVLDP